MMRRIFIVLFAAVVFTAGTGCGMDYDLRRVDDVLLNALNKKYSAASGVEWEKSGIYYVAEFHDNGSELKVWFKKGGEWCMTERDMGRNISEVPVSIVETMKAGKYAAWKIDDVDKYERPGEIFYVVSVETHGSMDRVLFFSETGTLLKDVIDRGDITPKTKL